MDAISLCGRTMLLKQNLIGISSDQVAAGREVLEEAEEVEVVEAEVRTEVGEVLVGQVHAEGVRGGLLTEEEVQGEEAGLGLTNEGEEGRIRDLGRGRRLGGTMMMGVMIGEITEIVEEVLAGTEIVGEALEEAIRSL